MKIKRDIVNKFKEWKDAAKHKPILLKGARQIGKTWAMEEFGKECFDYTAKFDFDRQKELLSAFTVSKEPARIIKELSLYSPVPLVPGKTLRFRPGFWQILRSNKKIARNITKP